ncbi:MAG: deoxycytidylate deaminase [Candidatus Woesearchaeota archaeon]
MENKNLINRPTWDEYFMNIARDISLRGTCLCVRIGCVIVKNKRILSTGYVGAPRKTKDCIERNACLRRSLNIPSGQRYELCRSVHSEQNAIINAARDGVKIEDSHMYLYGVRIIDGIEKLINVFPCFICKKMIINAGIKKVHSMTEKGSIKTFDVKDDYVKEWQEKDMLDDLDVYKTEYKTEKK